MTHLDDGTIGALLHDELPPATGDQARSHIAECASCRSLLERAREEDRWTREHLARLDVPAPRANLAGIRQASRRQRAARHWRRAALIVVVVGGASLAWALTPLPEFARRLLSPGAVPQRPIPTSATQQDTVAVNPVTGISVVPTERLVIAFDAWQEAGEIQIRLADRVDVSLVALDGEVRLESREGMVIVHNRDARATYDVEVPRAARDVEVTVGTTPLWHKRGDAIESRATRVLSVWVVQLRSAR
jgi:hypothetical protein